MRWVVRICLSIAGPEAEPAPANTRNTIVCVPPFSGARLCFRGPIPPMTHVIGPRPQQWHNSKLPCTVTEDPIEDAEKARLTRTPHTFERGAEHHAHLSQK
jgi:hypothetical protein